MHGVAPVLETLTRFLARLKNAKCATLRSSGWEAGEQVSTKSPTSESGQSSNQSSIGQATGLHHKKSSRVRAHRNREPGGKYHLRSGFRHEQIDRSFDPMYQLSSPRARPAVAAVTMATARTRSSVPRTSKPTAGQYGSSYNRLEAPIRALRQVQPRLHAPTKQEQTSNSIGASARRRALARRVPSAGPGIIDAATIQPLLVISKIEIPSRSGSGRYSARRAESQPRKAGDDSQLGARTKKQHMIPQVQPDGETAKAAAAGHGASAAASGGATARERLENQAAATKIASFLRGAVGLRNRRACFHEALSRAKRLPVLPAALDLVGLGHHVFPEVLAPVLTAMPCLEHLSVRGCAGLQPEAVQLIVKSCCSLEVLDMSGCALMGDEQLVAIGEGLRRLRVLEVGGWRRLSGAGLQGFAVAVSTVPVTLVPLAVPDPEPEQDVRPVAMPGSSPFAGAGMLSSSSSSSSSSSLQAHGIRRQDAGGSVGSGSDASIAGPRRRTQTMLVPEVPPAFDRRLAPHGTSPKLTLGQRKLITSPLRALNLSDCRGIDDASVAQLGRQLPGLRDLCLYGCLQLTGRSADGFGHLDCRLRRLNTAGVYKFDRNATSYLLQANPGLLLYNNPNEFDASAALLEGEQWVVANASV